MIRLSKAKFLYGCRGLNLDILARGPLWDIGIDYKCGTGHGIGFVSNVHEGPNGFRWKIVPERNDSCIFEEGMVTTNEPGVYIEGSHGIREENELICQRGPKVGMNQFMEFETIIVCTNRFRWCKSRVYGKIRNSMVK
ncbi:MAG: M24 family metallopeptidase [Clostridioides difficile]